MTPDEIARFDALREEYERIGREMCALIRAGVESIDAAKPGEIVHRLDEDGRAMLKAYARLSEIQREVAGMLINPVVTSELESLQARAHDAVESALQREPTTVH